NASVTTLPSQDFFKSGTDAIAVNAGLYEATLPLLYHLLQIRLRHLMLKLTLICLVLLLVLMSGAYIYLAFYQSVMDMVDRLEEVAGGDLTSAERIENRDEMGQACVRMIASLQELLGGVQNLSHVVSGSA